MDFMNLNQSAHGDREFGYVETPDAAQPDHRRRPLARPRGRRSDRRLGAGRLWRPRAPAAPCWPASATTCARSPSRKATRSRPRSSSASGSMATASATSSPRCTARPTPDVDRLVEEYDASYDMAPSLRRDGERRSALRDAARIEVGLRTLPRGRRLRSVHRHVRGPRRPRPAPGDRRPAPHGRRLRLRCGGRLEDGAARPGDEGHGDRPAGRDIVHGGLHVSPGPGPTEGPRGPHARGLPVDRGRDAVVRDPSAVDRPPVGPGPPRLHRPSRLGRRRRPARSRRPVPTRPQRGRGGQAARRPAAPPGRPRALGSPSPG